MNLRPRNVFILSLLVGAVVGGTISARYLWQGFVGLDPSAFPAGETFQSIGYAIFPALDISVGGLVLALGAILAFRTTFFTRPLSWSTIERKGVGRAGCAPAACRLCGACRAL